jgi:hypothetical protein
MALEPEQGDPLDAERVRAQESGESEQSTNTHLLHRKIASYCWAGGYEFGMGVVTRLLGS